MNVTKITWVGLSLVLVIFVLFSRSANNGDKMSLTSLPHTNTYKLFFSEDRNVSLQ